MDGSEDFYRSWQTYKSGFGKAQGNSGYVMQNNLIINDINFCTTWNCLKFINRYSKEDTCVLVYERVVMMKKRDK